MKIDPSLAYQYIQWRDRMVTINSALMKQFININVEELTGPQRIPALVSKHLILWEKVDPFWIPQLKAVVRNNSKSRRTYDIRIFDVDEAKAKGIEVYNYYTLDEFEELMLYEGWFNPEIAYVSLTEKAGLGVDTYHTILSQPEIWMKISILHEPGSAVFFYLAGGPMSGGPLGKGAAIVGLNPDYPHNDRKKYVVYLSDVDGMKPNGNRIRLFASDSTRQVANWINERNYIPKKPIARGCVAISS
jgi:hypothetical protein